jgi:hypothetical protein
MRFPGIALFAIGFSAALVASLAAIYWSLEAAQIEPLVTRHEVARIYRDKVAGYRRHEFPNDTYRIAFLGDSMAVSYPNEFKIAHVLETQLRRRSEYKLPVRVFDLGMAGTGSYDYYFLADVISELEPQLVIVEFNLVSPAQNFLAAFSRPELAGWIAPRRLATALGLPLGGVGLTFDELLLYVAVIRSGGFESWKNLSKQQTRVTESLRRIEDSVAIRNKKNRSPEDDLRLIREFWGLARNNLPEGSRFTRLAMREQLGPVLDGLSEDDPTLVVLRAVVRAFRDKGIDTLVYLNPINLDHVSRLGLSNDAGLKQSLDHIERAVTESGGLFLDLHDLFPDVMFRDRAGHLAFEGKINGPSRLASALAPSVTNEWQQHRRQRSETSD